MFVTTWKKPSKKFLCQGAVFSEWELGRELVLNLGCLQVKSFWLNLYLVNQSQQPNLLLYSKTPMSFTPKTHLFFVVVPFLSSHYNSMAAFGGMGMTDNSHKLNRPHEEDLGTIMKSSLLSWDLAMSDRYSKFQWCFVNQRSPSIVICLHTSL